MTSGLPFLAPVVFFVLQDAGYATYMAGKWDLGDLVGYEDDGRVLTMTATTGCASGALQARSTPASCRRA